MSKIAGNKSGEYLRREDFGPPNGGGRPSIQGKLGGSAPPFGGHASGAPPLGGKTPARAPPVPRVADDAQQDEENHRHECSQGFTVLEVGGDGSGHGDGEPGGADQRRATDQHQPGAHDFRPPDGETEPVGIAPASEVRGEAVSCEPQGAGGPLGEPQGGQGRGAPRPRRGGPRVPPPPGELMVGAWDPERPAP